MGCNLYSSNSNSYQLKRSLNCQMRKMMKGKFNMLTITEMPTKILWLPPRHRKRLCWAAFITLQIKKETCYLIWLGSLYLIYSYDNVTSSSLKCGVTQLRLTFKFVECPLCDQGGKYFDLKFKFWFSSFKDIDNF